MKRTHYTPPKDVASSSVVWDLGTFISTLPWQKTPRLWRCDIRRGFRGMDYESICLVYTNIFGMKLTKIVLWLLPRKPLSNNIYGICFAFGNVIPIWDCQNTIASRLYLYSTKFWPYFYYLQMHIKVINILTYLCLIGRLCKFYNWFIMQTHLNEIKNEIIKK